MAKFKVRGRIHSHLMLTEGIYDLKIEVPEIAKAAAPGQFVSLYLDDPSRLLPRPISICEICPDGRGIRLVYRVTGENTGTDILSRYEKGREIEILGPLGNGFPLDKDGVLLIGGGIGIPPMLEMMKRLKGRRTAVLGYRDSGLFLKEDFEKYGSVYTATEDGSFGAKGNVMDAIREYGIEGSVIMACGPLPMLRAVKSYAAEHGIECYVSMEEKMACGIGACLACVCESAEIDEHSNVNNKRICKDGPVFRAEEVVL